MCALESVSELALKAAADTSRATAGFVATVVASAENATVPFGYPLVKQNLQLKLQLQVPF